MSEKRRPTEASLRSAGANSLNNQPRIWRLRSRTDRVGRGQGSDDRCFLGSANGMAPSAGAPGMAVGVLGNIMHHIIIMRGANAARNVIQIQRVPDFPGDDVVGAGSVAADAYGAEQFSRQIIQGESTAKHIDPADFFTNQRIVLLAIISRRTFVRGAGIDWITVLEPKER